MDETENVPLLDKIDNKPTGLRALIEVVLIISASYHTMATLTIQQYVFQSLSRECQYASSDINYTSGSLPHDNRSSTTGVAKANNSDSSETQCQSFAITCEQKTQADSASVMLILTTSRYLAVMVSASFLGPFSDVHGRKSTILVPLFGTVLQCIVLVTTSGFDLSYWYLLIGYILEGICGSSTVVFMCVSAYIADISTKTRISMRITIMEVCNGLATAIGSSASGLFIDSVGYFYAFVIILGLAFVNLFFVIFILKETRKRDTKSKVQCRYLLGWIKLYIYDSKTKRRWKLQLSMALLLIACFVQLSLSDPRTYLLKGSPFYFTAIQIGIFVGVASFVQNSGSAVGVRLLGNVLGDHWLMLIGFVSMTASLLMFGFASTAWMVILAPALGIFSLLIVPMVRSISSKLVEPDEQGAVFSGIACAEAVMYIVGVFTFNSVYSATLQILPGFVFLVMAAVEIFGLALASCQVYLMRHQTQTYWTAGQPLET